jgi:hypothetical protein
MGGGIVKSPGWGQETGPGRTTGKYFTLIKKVAGRILVLYSHFIEVTCFKCGPKLRPLVYSFSGSGCIF